ncbi:MAG: hypothetical protein NVS3B16_00940 [Vulcanimicrobiaceae bacterium]
MNVRFGSEIVAAAAAHHLDPRLLAAVAAQETGGPGSNSGRNVVGDGGHGHGIFQIDDRYWAFARTAAALDPARNADVAAGILSDGLRRFGGNVRAALSAYNAGSPTATGTQTRWGDGRVLGYADSVLRHYALLGGSTEQIAADARAAASAGDPLRGAAGTVPALVANAPLPPPLPRPGLGPGAYALPPPAQPGLPLPPLQSWTQMTAASSQEAAAADKALADLIDGGDVFGRDADPANEL